MSTPYGNFFTGSPLSYQLSIFEANFKVLSNVNTNPSKNINNKCLSDCQFQFPYDLIAIDCVHFPTDWGISNYSEMMILSQIFPETLEKCRMLFEAIALLNRPYTGRARRFLWMMIMVSP